MFAPLVHAPGTQLVPFHGAFAGQTVMDAEPDTVVPGTRQVKVNVPGTLKGPSGREPVPGLETPFHAK